ILAVVTLTLGVRARYARHVRIAKWTLPIWLYVSVAGVIVYLMLSALYPHAGGPMPVPPALGRAARIFRRGLRLECPRCGGARLFSGWFTMASECPLCGLRYERAQGYFVGAIYINYAMTVTIMIGGGLLLWRYAGFSTAWQLVLWVPFGV